MAGYGFWCRSFDLRGNEREVKQKRPGISPGVLIISYLKILIP